MAPDVTSHMPFLAKSQLYEQEKLYGADFSVEDIEGAKITNHVFSIRQVTFHDIRNLQIPLCLEENGACFVKATTSLSAEAACTKRTEAMMNYVEEIVNVVRTHFPQYVEVQFMDYQVRKRSTAFPNGHGQRVDYAQPATMPHTDFSSAGCYLRMKDVFVGQEHHYVGRDFDLINVWRVLKGPNNDWPLAVCDFSSINIDEETTTNDALHLTRTGENWLLYPSDTHQWYYMSDMEPEDLIIFRNADSKGELSRCFHAAFNNPQSTSDPREIIEVRLVGFRN